MGMMKLTTESNSMDVVCDLHMSILGGRLRMKASLVYFKNNWVVGVWRGANASTATFMCFDAEKTTDMLW